MAKSRMIPLSAAAIAAMIALSGCGTQKIDDTGSKARAVPGSFEMDGNRNETLSTNYLGIDREPRDPSWGRYGSLMNGGGMHSNGTIAVNEDLARQIALLDGVESATVLVSDVNAYVGLRLHEKLSGSNGAHMKNGTELPGVRNDANPAPGMAAKGAETETGRYGTTKIMGIRDYNGTMRQYNDAGQINAGAPDLSTEPPAQTRNPQAPSASGMQGSYGGLSSLGYGAGTQANGVSSFLKTQIEDLIRSRDTTIRHVFISAEPEFLGELENYVGRIDQGSAVRTYLNPFNAMAERFFPSELGGDPVLDNNRVETTDSDTNQGVHMPRTLWGIYPSMDNNFLDRPNQTGKLD
ncbi:YhcN/YlaJ family sporulation lipoprotein [Paenibacillus turpanensis]|uniref:YhcN/YlaJ family sporulation lipoprotein n=1 Tax=Paenibacillus turpanensis TaxID=2689078 RepID=UPI0014083C2F|nr:YhcN/YlaJ family sporulation lipoprotein [Paenibacillus turpanensis]